MTDRADKIKSSIRKWGPDLWDRLSRQLEMYLDDSAHPRKEAFLDLLWSSCGFCSLYSNPGLDDACWECPLDQGFCNSDMGECVRTNRCVGVILLSWQENNRPMFEWHRRELIKFMAQQLLDKKNDCEWRYNKGDLGCVHPERTADGYPVYCDAIVYVSNKFIIGNYGEPIELFNFRKCKLYQKEVIENKN